MNKLIRWKMHDDKAATLSYSEDEGGSWNHYVHHPSYSHVGEYRDCRDGSPGFKMMQWFLKNGYSMVNDKGEKV